MFRGSSALGAETEDESFEGLEDPDDEASLLPPDSPYGEGGRGLYLLKQALLSLLWALRLPEKALIGFHEGDCIQGSL